MLYKKTDIGITKLFVLGLNAWEFLQLWPLSWPFLSSPAFTCSANSTYDPCMSACPASCANLAAPSGCDLDYCMEGCKCAEGFVMSEGSCVPYSGCGCDYLGRYYLVREHAQQEAYCRYNVTSYSTCGLNSNCPSVPLQLLETFVTEDCSMTCQCTSTGVVCQTKSCAEDHECTIYDSKRDCFRGQLFAHLVVVKHACLVQSVQFWFFAQLPLSKTNRFN